MPSKIEKLIAGCRAAAELLDDGTEVTLCARLAHFERMCADELERAYREEVLPLVNALFAAEPELHYAHPLVREIVAEALRPFDAPAPEEPFCPKHSPKGIVCDCDLAPEEPKQ